MTARKVIDEINGDPRALARLLELEHRCERCRAREAVCLFDRQFLCRRCKLTLELRLAREALR